MSRSVPPVMGLHVMKDSKSRSAGCDRRQMSECERSEIEAEKKDTETHQIEDEDAPPVIKLITGED